MSRARPQLAFAGLIGCALLAARPAGAAEPVPAATILDVRGPVTWRASASEAFHAAHGGDRLYAGAEVTTGVQGFATMAWRNGGTFKLMPESDLVIPPEEGVRLNAGKIWAEFKHKLLVPFFFQGPSATAVVRGTVLDVEVLDQGATRVAVFEGHVEVAGNRGGRHVMLDPGQSINVSPFGQLGPVEPVGAVDRLGLGRPGVPALAFRQPPGPDGPVKGLVGWLDGNRAAVRMENQRLQMRQARAGMPGGPPVEFRTGPGPEPGDGPGKVIRFEEAGGKAVMIKGGAMVQFNTGGPDAPPGAPEGWGLTQCFPAPLVPKCAPVPLCPVPVPPGAAPPPPGAVTCGEATKGAP